MVAIGKKRIVITLTDERLEQLQAYCKYYEVNKSDAVNYALLDLFRATGFEDSQCGTGIHQSNVGCPQDGVRLD